MTDQIKTVTLLKEGHVSYSQIENDLGITKDQLTRLANYHWKYPAPELIKCLHDYLVREKKHRVRQERGCKK